LDWDLIFGCAVKAISSPGVRSPYAAPSSCKRSLFDVSIISEFTIDSLSNVRGEFEVLVHHHDDERSTEGHPQRLGRDLNWGGGQIYTYRVLQTIQMKLILLL
jgi:hypothetical protein